MYNVYLFCVHLPLGLCKSGLGLQATEINSAKLSKKEFIGGMEVGPWNHQGG